LGVNINGIDDDLEYELLRDQNDYLDPKVCPSSLNKSNIHGHTTSDTLNIGLTISSMPVLCYHIEMCNHVLMLIIF
jgi:hypothetical protein